MAETQEMLIDAAKAERSFYIGYKECGCPVAAVDVDSAPREVLAESIGEMIIAGYRVVWTATLPDAFLNGTCTHGR